MSDSVRIYIVEDEGVTRVTLEDCLEEMGYEVVGWADNAEKAWNELQKMEVDIAFFDINLAGEKNGIWLAEQLNASELKMPFIFLTAYGDEATVKDAVKTKPNGYLVKPFQSVDIFTSIAVAMENFTRDAPGVATLQGEGDHENGVRINDSIFIRDDYMFTKLRIAEILYVKSASNYLEIHLEGKRHLIRKSLKDFLEMLPNDQFVQIHRSYLVNKEAIDSFGAGFVQIKGTEIPIGASYRDEFQGMFRTV